MDRAFGSLPPKKAHVSPGYDAAPGHGRYQGYQGRYESRRFESVETAQAEELGSLIHATQLKVSEAWRMGFQGRRVQWLITMVSKSPKVGLFPFQMAFLWLINGGLLTTY